MEASPRSKLTEQISEIRDFQNENTRDYKDLPPDWGVGHDYRFQGCLLPYTNKHTVQEVPAFSSSGSVLPIQSATIWSAHSTHGIHSGSQRGNIDGLTQGYKNPPVPSQLATLSQIPPNLSQVYTNPSCPLRN